ncbi:alpha/beta fold hydrolase [Aquisediminimonas sediminicola]|uniref:alpha/beta fold hydrolase n=1 Tax=Alteraquisediminimonas sediminicola TaxID=2676787 RepID=UPI001C8F16FA|nr:alpha/beta hydrolase [Aquisediminimonas sediminicola]
MTETRIALRTHPPGMEIGTVPMVDGWPVRVFDYQSINDLAGGSAPPRGSLMFITGLGEFFEKYLCAINQWHQSGWNISGFDWRGQGDSGRLLANPHIGHIDDYAVFVDDLARIIDHWQRHTPPPHVLVTHSMGGHVTLRALAEQRIRVDAVAMSAPMLGLPTGPLPESWALQIADILCHLGLARHAAWRRAERPLLPWLNRAQLLTHDADRYADEQDWIARQPSLELGPPSWGWLRAAFRSLALLHRPGMLERIDTPLLMMMAGRDRLVANRATQAAAARLADVRTLMIDGAFHELLRETDQYRDQAMNAIDAFLDDVAPRPA